MEKNHITVPENCTGCALCANVCAKDAIKMVWSDDGFLVPSVEEPMCIGCGLCVRNCPVQEENRQKLHCADDDRAITCFGAWNQDADIHDNSSSGGVFSALADRVIADGGCVFGVVWGDKLNLVFEKAETLEQLERMRGSKYTHANAAGVYREVRRELQSGRRVLFSGTSCQVHALRQFLRREYDNLLTVDIVCHGMPSHLILEKYIEHWEKTAGSPIRRISFREKPEGWLNYHVARYYEDGTKHSVDHHKDMYMRLFLSDLALNKVCYNCPYAHLPRRGDITLGDYWGVQQIHPDWPIRHGISAVLANSAKGQAALGHCSHALSLIPEDFESIYAKQKVVYIRPKRQVPRHRARALRLLKKLPITKALHCILECDFCKGIPLVRKSPVWYLYKIAVKMKHLLMKKK